MAEENLISSSKFLKEFTLSIIKVIESKKFNISTRKIIVDADLIPELSEELMKEYAQNKDLLNKLEQIGEMNFLEPEPVILRPLTNSQHQGIKNIGLMPPIKSQQQPIINIQAIVAEGNGYEKIKPLLDDYSVSRIQCIAPQKPLVIIRSGQKQITKINLTQNEIQDVFLYFSEMAHIPLIEGPFKVLLREMSINGINSKLTESKFIIQKQTAYSLLEHPESQNSGMPMRRR